MPHASPDLASAGSPGKRRSPRLGLLRMPPRQLSAGRILHGARLGDAGFFLTGVLMIWAPIIAPQSPRPAPRLPGCSMKPALSLRSNMPGWWLKLQAYAE